MSSVTELPLPFLAMEEPGFAADPFPQFAAARAQHPWLAKSAFGYVVTEYSAIKDLLSMDDRLVGRVLHGPVPEHIPDYSEFPGGGLVAGPRPDAEPR